MATKAPRTFTPSELAERLNVSPKNLRAYLRANFPRNAEAKNTSWTIDLDTAKAVQAHYAERASSNDSDES